MLVEADKIVRELAQDDPFVWAHSNNITLYNEPYDPKRYPFQVEILRSRAKHKVIKKGVQLGITRTVMNQIFHGLLTPRYPHGVLYGHPSDREVTDFVKSRFNPMITENYEAIGRFVQDTDTVNLKQLNGKFLYMRGFRSTTNIGGVLKESSRLASITVDAVVRDEKDLMDPSMVLKANERMDGSEVKEEIDLSKPSIPDYGIDRDYQNSSMGYWVIKCFYCGTETSPDKEFPDSVRLREDSTGYLCCKKCHREIKPTDPGFYIHENKDLLGTCDGWWVSQLLIPTIDPGVILREYENPPNGDLGQVKRRRLGLAHIDAEDILTTQQVYDCCGNEPMSLKSDAMTAMGVDVGKVLHYIIGRKTGPKSHRILRIGQVNNYKELRDIARRFNVKSEVEDMLPTGDEKREYMATAGHDVLLCHYMDNWGEPTSTDEDKGIIKIDRNEICGKSHRVIAENMIVLPRRCQEIEVMARHCSALVKTVVKDEKSGTMIYRYVARADDHHRHALNYYLLAANNLRYWDSTAGEAGRDRTEYDVLRS